MNASKPARDLSVSSFYLFCFILFYFSSLIFIFTSVLFKCVSVVFPMKSVSPTENNDNECFPTSLHPSLEKLFHPESTSSTREPKLSKCEFNGQFSLSKGYLFLAFFQTLGKNSSRGNRINSRDFSRKAIRFLSVGVNWYESDFPKYLIDHCRNYLRLVRAKIKENSFTKLRDFITFFDAVHNILTLVFHASNYFRW